MSWASPIEANRQWWRTQGSAADDNPFSDYDRDDIVAENRYGDAIVRLNDHIITTNSQSGQYDEHPSVPDPEHVKFFEQVDGVPKGSLDGCLWATHQRPYLCAVANRSLLKRFREELSEVGVLINDSSEVFSNETFDAMRIETASGVNVTRIEFFNPSGRVVCTLYPTNIWAEPYPWEDEIHGVPASALDQLGMITFVATEYREDGEQMLRSILGQLDQT